MNEVDVYLGNVAEPERAELERIRKIVRTAVPDAKEVISYGMPGFKHKNKYLCGYAAFKAHMSFFPSSEPIEVLEERLVGYKLSRGTVQFTLEKPIPEKLIRELIDIRVRAIDGTNNS